MIIDDEDDIGDTDDIDDVGDAGDIADIDVDIDVDIDIVLRKQLWQGRPVRISWKAAESSPGPPESSWKQRLYASPPAAPGTSGPAWPPRLPPPLGRRLVQGP